MCVYVCVVGISETTKLNVISKERAQGQIYKPSYCLLILNVTNMNTSAYQ